MPSNVLPLHLKQTFPPIIWIFTEGEGAWDRMEAIFLKKDAFTYNFQVDPLFQVPEGSERLWCIHINFIRCSSKPHFGNGKTQWTGICGDKFCLGTVCFVMLLLFAGRSKRFEHLHDYDPTYHGQSKTDSKLYILSTIIAAEQFVLAHNPKVILYKSQGEKTRTFGPASHKIEVHEQN